MKKTYVGSSKELALANFLGVSEKAKRIIGTALFSGALTIASIPINANAYTREQLNEHQQYVEEVILHYNNIEKETKSYLEDLLKSKKITIEQYETMLGDLTKKIETNSSITISELKSKPQNVLDKNLIFMKIFPKQPNETKPKIKLTLNDISSLDLNQIERLEKEYIIDSIELNRYYEADGNKPVGKMFKYSLDTYKKLLNVINKKFGDLKEQNNLTELEKATIVLKRMENLTYANEVLSIPVTKDPNPKLFTSRNLVDPLLNNTGICAGYSDLFKNVMSYIGIEAKEIRGYVKNINIIASTLPGEANHAWNQVKLDGKWCNIDITQIISNKEILKPNKPHPYLFTDNSELRDRTSITLPPPPYLAIFGLNEKDTYSFSQKEIDNALKVATKYEKNRKKIKGSIIFRIAKKLDNIKNNFANSRRSKKKDFANKRINANKILALPAVNDEKAEFSNYLSANGKYVKNTTNLTNSQISKNLDKQNATKTEVEPFERS